MSEFYKELDRRETQAKADRLSNRPANIHNYQGCAKYSPGPWDAHIGLDYFAVYNSSGNTVVPESICNPENERDVADAYLIAAAPELLEALKGILAITDSNDVAWEKARAAIAKAEPR